jgi:hypothetical protein
VQSDYKLEVWLNKHCDLNIRTKKEQIHIIMVLECLTRSHMGSSTCVLAPVLESTTHAATDRSQVISSCENNKCSLLSFSDQTV